MARKSLVELLLERFDDEIVLALLFHQLVDELGELARVAASLLGERAGLVRAPLAFAVRAASLRVRVSWLVLRPARPSL